MPHDSLTDNRNLGYPEIRRPHVMRRRFSHRYLPAEILEITSSHVYIAGNELFAI